MADWCSHDRKCALANYWSPSWRVSVCNFCRCAWKPHCVSINRGANIFVCSMSCFQYFLDTLMGGLSAIGCTKEASTSFIYFYSFNFVINFTALSMLRSLEYLQKWCLAKKRFWRKKCVHLKAQGYYECVWEQRGLISSTRCNSLLFQTHPVTYNWLALFRGTHMATVPGKYDYALQFAK